MAYDIMVSKFMKFTVDKITNNGRKYPLETDLQKTETVRTLIRTTQAGMVLKLPEDGDAYLQTNVCSWK